MLSKLHSHFRHNVVGYLALFFALSGGAFAANTYIRTTDAIPSSSDLTNTYGSPLIANGKVTGGTGGKIADDSVTGADIDESSLGKVGDANTLDGLDSGDFTPANQVHTPGRVVLNDPIPGDDQKTGSILFTAGSFAVSARCAADYAPQGGDDVAELVVDGPGNSSFVGPRVGEPDFNLSSGVQAEVASISSSVPQLVGGHIIAAAPSGSVVSVSGSAEVGDPAGDCVFAVTGLGH
jgi:hypothetical protein